MNMMSRILIAVVSRDLKTPEKGAETKNKMLPCDLKKNESLQMKVFEFVLYPKTKTRKSRKFTSIFYSNCNSRFKYNKKMN